MLKINNLLADLLIRQMLETSQFAKLSLHMVRAYIEAQMLISYNQNFCQVFTQTQAYIF